MKTKANRRKSNQVNVYTVNVAATGKLYFSTSFDLFAVPNLVYIRYKCVDDIHWLLEGNACAEPRHHYDVSPFNAATSSGAVN